MTLRNLHTAVRRLPAFGLFHSLAEKRRVAAWERSGRPAPPPHSVKVQDVLSYAQRFGLRTFVETGTYMGDMVAAMRPHFDRLYSIELDAYLASEARRRFRGDDRVTIVEGDSGKELPRLIQTLTTPTLFWLDGHFSGGVTAQAEIDTPVREELSAILSHPLRHVILIDDARLFGVDKDYPSLDEVRASLPADASYTVENDIIRIFRKA